MRVLGSALAAVVLSGCMAESNMKTLDPSALSEPIHASYREVIKIKLRSTLLDYDAIKSTRISQPYAMTDANGNGRWLVCVEYNAKNGYGAYAGVDQHAYLFANGRVWGPNEYGGSPLIGDVCQHFPLTWNEWRL